MYKYLKIGQYRKHIERLSTLMHEYWDSLPRQEMANGQISCLGDSGKSVGLRKEILHLLPYVIEEADVLGISHRLHSYPIAGGPVVSVDLFDAIVDPNKGYRTIDRKKIIDCVEKAISTARKRQKEALFHSLCPWNWIIDGCAWVIRLPFVILRRAGLPPKVEENIISQVIKVVCVIIIIAYVAYKGLKIDLGLLLKLIGF